jgi:hypothetical protein
MFQFIKKPTALALTLVTTLNASAALAETQSFDLSGFEGVSAAEGITLQVSVGSTFEVSAESEDDRLLENLSLDVTRGVLVAEMDDGLSAPNWVTGDKVEVRVAMPALERATRNNSVPLQRKDIKWVSAVCQNVLWEWVTRRGRAIPIRSVDGAV